MVEELGPMRSEKTWVSKRVRVQSSYRKPELRDLVGTVEQRYGDPSYTALEERFGDGRSQLFWHYELEKVDDEPPEQSWWRRVFDDS
jgi:hypothetical protein